MSALDNAVQRHARMCNTNSSVWSRQDKCDCDQPEAAAELAALRARIAELEKAQADRYFACTYCGLMLPYNGNNPGERERICAEMDEHAAKCECDPKNARIAKLEAVLREIDFIADDEYTKLLVSKALKDGES